MRPYLARRVILVAAGETGKVQTLSSPTSERYTVFNHFFFSFELISEPLLYFSYSTRRTFYATCRTMSSAAGLSRRRVATASSSSASGDDQPSSGRNTNGSASNGAAATHAGSAFEGGNKIAFDPRDLDQDREDTRYGGKMPRLTLMEEVLLLGLKDKHVRGMSSHCIYPLHHPCDLRPRFPQHECSDHRRGVSVVAVRMSSSTLPLWHPYFPCLDARGSLLDRATSLFGMTASRTPSGGAYSSNSRFAVG